MVTGELTIDKQELDLLDEDKLSDDVVPDPQKERTMISTSVEVHTI